MLKLRFIFSPFKDVKRSKLNLFNLPGIGVFLRWTEEGGAFQSYLNKNDCNRYRIQLKSIEFLIKKGIKMEQLIIISSLILFLLRIFVFVLLIFLLRFFIVVSKREGQNDFFQNKRFYLEKLDSIDRFLDISRF